MRALVLPSLLVLFATGAACTDRSGYPDGPKNNGSSGGASSGAPGEGPDDPGGPKDDTPYEPDLAVAPRGSCSQVRTGGEGLVIQAKLLMPGATMLENGELFVGADGSIRCAAASCAGSEGYAEAGMIRCENTVASPGLINTHDHITYVISPPDTPRTARYDHRNEWRLGINGKRRIFSRSTTNENEKSAGELRFLFSGATSTNGSGTAPHLVRNLDKADGREGLGGGPVNYETFPLGSGEDNMATDGCSSYSRYRKTRMEFDSAFAPHISEGINLEARNEFVCATGVDDNTFDIIEPNTAVIHGVAATPEDVATYREQRSILIWSPRSNLDLYGDTAPVAMYDHAGVPIALGTDWLPSGSMNMSRELRCAADFNAHHLNRHFSDAKLWQMVTENAAMAMGVNYSLGYLKAGYTGDIALFSEEFGRGHTAVVHSTPSDVMLVLRGGKVMYGDAAVLDLPAVGGGACEGLPICGVEKKACVREDRFVARLPSGNCPSKSTAEGELCATDGFDLENLLALATKYYPVESCRGVVPLNEPSCAPMRPNQYDGVTEFDSDGDGVLDEEDNCKYVFNPPRPMTQGEQPDSDGDGVGDACDPCPLDANAECTGTSWDDADGDGLVNWLDNCPDHFNPGQEDRDGDGRGDACSAAEAALLTIPEIRNPNSPKRPADGAMVRVENVKVGRTRSGRGWFLQSSADQPFSGIYVYTSGALNGVSIGDTVTVEGKFVNFNGFDEITNPVVTILADGVTADFYPALVKTPEEIAANRYAWQSMLLSIPDTTVQSFDATGTSFPVKGSSATLRVNNNFYANLVPQIRDTLTVGQSITRIVGTLAYTNELWPSQKADFTLP